MPSKRKRSDTHTILTTAESSTANGKDAATTSTNTQEAVVLSSAIQSTSSAHRSDNDIQAEISRRREALKEEEHNLSVSLSKARIERAVLAQARIIIDARIRDLQSKV